MTLLETEVPASGIARRPWVAIALLALLLAVHIVQAVRIFPTPKALCSDDYPVLLVDHAIHLYHGALGSRFLRKHGTTWGYDPFFMAGYPETPVWDSSSNLSILFQALAGGGYHPQAYNIGLFVCSILVVAFVPAGAAACGLRLQETFLAALFGWLYFHCAWPGWFWRSGLFAFITASGGLVLLLGLLSRYEDGGSAGRFWALAAMGSAFLYAHVTGPIMALGGVLGFTVAATRRHSRRWWLGLFAAATLAIIVNLFWLVPLWRFRGIRAAQGLFLTPTSGWFLIKTYLSYDLDGLLGLLILVLGTSGLLVWVAEGHRTRAATFGGTALVCFCLASFGGLWSVTRLLEPLRFVAPLHLVLSVPAGSALGQGTARLARALGGGRRGALLAAVAWSGVLGGMTVAIPDLLQGAGRCLLIEWPRPLAAGIQPEMRELVRWLGTNTDPSARILFEDQLRLYEKTDPESTHWTPLLPILLGTDPRQFVGGLYQMPFINHQRAASFGDFYLGGRPIDEWTREMLHQYCELYNIGWVVCWSPLSRCVFDHWSDAHRVAALRRFQSPNRPVSRNEHEWQALLSHGSADQAASYLREGAGQYVIYRVARPHSFFLSGEGRLVSVDLNRLELADLVPGSKAALVLSLHWLDTWRTDPPLPLDPVVIPGDPVPFIRISTAQPHKRLVLYNAYGR